MNDFDLNSRKWLALIFADKNKEYGAYVHRDESSNRHLKALLIITAAAFSLIFLPGFVKSVLPEGKDDSQAVEVNLSIIDNNLDDLKEEDVIKAFEPPPPPELKATVAFTPPVITKDENIREDELIKTQMELTEIKADISVKTVEGVEGGNVDIADLLQHKVIVEDKKEEIQIFNHVEEMPKFPGGDQALLKWLSDNIQYPPIAQEQGIQGTVSIRFVVKPDGSVDDVEIVKSLDPSCDREAVRQVKRLPKFIPGKQNGNPVHVYFNLPVRFKLQQQQ